MSNQNKFDYLKKQVASLELYNIQTFIDGIDTLLLDCDGKLFVFTKFKKFE